MKFIDIILKILKPLIDSELEAVANELAASKEAIVAAAAQGGQSVQALVAAEVQKLVAAKPVLALVASTFAPALEAYIAGLVASGQADVGPLVDQVVAFIRHEEQYI